MPRLIDADELLKKKMCARIWEGTIYETTTRVVTVGFINSAPTINPDDLRPRGRWILTAHKENVNYRWHVTAECSECCDEEKKIWAGFFPNVPDCIAKEAAMVSAESVKLANYCPNCGARMEGKDEQKE